ncbi:hypothetical protein [Roseateles sp. YR242]|uniref:hypothetical protein n=1 Tax=Roseateles sp. YR242 TaxID=1855305 RepID=UPI001160CDCD|nr:hypothetical protein [Roseateles sp. YR242]
MLALLQGLAGAVMVYLASPHQRWCAVAWPPAARWSGLAVWLLSLVPWWQAMRPLAAVFACCAWSMLLFGALPAVGAWCQVRKTRGTPERRPAMDGTKSR